MARFLSDEWISAMNEAAASESLRQSTRNVRLSIQKVVKAGHEERCYLVRVDHGRVSVEPGRDPAADLTITEDAETAAALAKGEMSPQIAFMLGRIRVSGDMPALMASYEALSEVDDAFAPVRATTSYE